MDVTVAKAFQEAARLFHERPAQRIRQAEGFLSLSYGQLYERVKELGTGLQSLGIRQGDKVGLVSDNRPEWLVCDLACVCIGAADVPRGSDTTAQEIEYILGHSDAVAAFVENGRQLEKVQSIRPRLPNLRLLVVMDPSWTGSGAEGVHRVLDVAAEGRRKLTDGDEGFEKALLAIKAQDLATIIYTSGTTGEPKGVMLSHRNFMHNIEVLPGLLDLNHTDRWLSILPPWHVFERIAEYIIMGTGASISYTTIRTFAQDMAAVRPTFIASVPRIWEGIYAKVMAKMEKEPEKTRKIFFGLVSLSKKYVKAKKVLEGRDALYDAPPPLSRTLTWLRSLLTVALLFPLYAFAQNRFAPIRGRTGGALRAAISGGGALPPYVDDFFAAVGITLLEGYGLTETSPVVAARTFERQVLGTVGLPVPETEVKIVDPSGEELPPGQKGIVKVRGAQVMAGYYKRPDMTAQVIDDEGWFDTGDLGRMTVRGELSLTGRAKETIVLMGGENVEPTPIEDALTESSYIAQAMVVGQDRKTLGLLVVPAFDALAEREEFRGRTPGQLCGEEGVLAVIRDEIRRLVSEERGFRPFERPSRVRLLDREFAVGDELTHTMKKRRNIIAERHAALIEDMFR